MTRLARPTRLGLHRCAALLSVCAIVAGLGGLGPGASAAVDHHAPAASERGLPSWWYDAMRIGEAHKQSTGKGVTVGVIDQGIDPTAADIRGADVSLVTDCDGNKLKPSGPEGGDHGTAMTTLLVGTGRGNARGRLGIRGVAPDASVLFYGMDTNPNSVFADCDSLDGADLIRKAANDGVDILTISLGFAGVDQVEAAVRFAMAKGVVVVAATGNRAEPTVSGWMNFPAGFPGVVGAQAVDRHAKPWKNNPRPVLHHGQLQFPVISAPGVDVTNSGYEKGRGWISGGTRTGTSDSAPIVAGALALVKSKYPDATANQLIQHLIHHPSAGAYGWDPDYGFGIVSIPKMLAQDPTGWPDENPLLNGPQRAVQDYPTSAYAAPGTNQDDSSASASPTPDGSSTGDGGAGGSSEKGGEAADSSGGGMPGWVWPLGGLLVLGGAAAAVAANVRGRRRTATANETATGV